MSKKNNNSTDELRRRAELRLKERKQKRDLFEATADVQRLIHELEVHQIELEVQNEELLQARLQLESYLEQYTDLYDFAPVGYFTLERGGTILQANLTGSNMLGVERSKLVNRPFGLFIPAEYRPVFNSFLEKVFLSQAKKTCEVAIHKTEKQLLHVHIEARPLENGQQCSIAVVNISERKQAEEALQESNKRYKELLEQTSDWVWEIDTEVKFTYTNPRIFEIMGYNSTADIIGKTLFDLMEPAESASAKLFFEGIMRRQESFALYNSSKLHPDEYPVFFETSGVPFFDEQGSLLGYRGISRDVTARKQAETEAVRVEALQAIENERMRLARELHDDVGMILFALKLDLQILSASISDADVRLREKLQGSIDKINDSILKVRQKSAYLRPPALDDLGLITIIKDLVEEINQKTSMNIRLRVSPKVPEFNPEVENALYRCIQESLTNAARHASARNLLVDLTWNSKKITCRIQDDGIGFDANTFNDCSSNHLGLLGMKERVFLLKGTIDINSSPGQGTDIKITIPQ